MYLLAEKKRDWVSLQQETRPYVTGFPSGLLWSYTQCCDVNVLWSQQPNNGKKDPYSLTFPCQDQYLYKWISIIRK
jgi:hypothetical protein